MVQFFVFCAIVLAVSITGLVIFSAIAAIVEVWITEDDLTLVEVIKDFFSEIHDTVVDCSRRIW